MAARTRPNGDRIGAEKTINEHLSKDRRSWFRTGRHNGPVHRQDHTSGGRRGGVSHSNDSRLDVNFSTPGVPGCGTNPGQLFAAGWSACFISAIVKQGP
jgi:hypothetical protein